MPVTTTSRAKRAGWLPRTRSPIRLPQSCAERVTASRPVDGVHQTFDPRHMAQVPAVLDADRLVRAAHPDVVGADHPEPTGGEQRIMGR